MSLSHTIYNFLYEMLVNLEYLHVYVVGHRALYIELARLILKFSLGESCVYGLYFLCHINLYIN